MSIINSVIKLLSTLIIIFFFVFGLFFIILPNKSFFKNISIDFTESVLGLEIKSGNESRQLCVEQISSSVQWVKEINQLSQVGFSKFYETGPGKVLTGLFRAFDLNVECFPAGSVDNIEAAISKSHNQESN